MNKQRSLRRGCALLLALVMCVSLLQLPAMAAEEHVHNQDGWTCVQGELTCQEEHEHSDACCAWECTAPAPAGEACWHQADPETVAGAAATCTAEGRRSYVCALCGEAVTEVLPAADHTPVVDAAVEPTETEAGLTEGSHCAVCGAVLTAQEVVPALERREDPEAAALQAFYDAVDALEALNGQEDPDPEAVLAAQEKVTGLYKGLTQVQKDNLNPIYTEMVKGLETPVTMEEPETDPVVEDAFRLEDADGEVVGTYATLAEAVTAANDGILDGATVYVLRDETVTACARFYNISLTIDGQGHKLTRGDGFATISDNARSWYNPAMIEVQTGSAANTAALTLKDIILDDAGKHEGTVFSQAVSGHTEDGNLKYVQDAIVASNATGEATITLGSGAILRNFGGESAVRVTNNAKVVMKAGSKIEDTIEGLTRVKGANGSNGPAGAVWIQGGELVMEQGSEISSLDGRAVYIDGGNATVNGTISNITGNMNMWQNESGVAIHVRNKGYAVLGETGVIENITGDHAAYRGAVATNGSRDPITDEGLDKWLNQDQTSEETRAEVLWDFEAKPGSVIRNVIGFPTLYSNYGTELLNGTITGCANDFIIGGFAQKTVIGESGVIENCTASKGAANAVVYTSNASDVYLKGAVRNNTASYAFYIINQSGGGAKLWMYDGALIANNSSTGVYVNASECAFYMHGGTITGNGSHGAYIREKLDRSATFIMDGGEITNNESYGVYYSGSSGNKQGYIDLNDGKISGNGSDYSPYQVNITGAYARDDKVRVHIAPGVVQAGNGKQATVNTSFGTLTLDAGYDEIDLGNAKSAASSEITTLAKLYETPGAYTTVGSALWFKPTTETLHFLASRSSSINPSNYLKLGYIPLKADGTPVEGAELTLTVLDVENTDPVDVTLPGLKPDQPYALMWVVPNEDATGSLQLTGTPAVSEVLDPKDPYQVAYKFSYTLRELFSSISAGDTFTATITLDKNVKLTAENPVKFSSSYFETDGEQWYHYDAAENTLTATFKAKGAKWYTFSAATITINTTFDGKLFDDGVKQLESSAALTGSLASEAKVNLKTNLPTITKLVPLGHVSVVFDTGDGGSYVETQVPKIGMTATRPADPTRPGYTFVDWYLGDAAEPYDFNTPVTENITLTARWTINNYTVTFNSNGGSTVPSQTVSYGSLATQPASPTRAGYTFTGWTLNGAVYSFATPVTGDITLTAAWSYNGGGGGGGGTGTGGGGGGGGRGTTTILEDQVPLAGDLQLNREDHFAYIKGYDDGTVRPNNPLTRAQVATIYYRLLTDTSREIYFQEANDFTDVPDDFWACKAISTLSNAGIINGFEDGTFRPNAYITRAQFIAMTARFETVVPGLENVFSDVAETHWARDEIAFAAFSGWLPEGNTFRPQENITRVETMEIINNVLERHVDAEGVVEGFTAFTDVPATSPYYYVVAEATNSHDWTRRTEGQLMENWSKLNEDPVWDE